MFRECVEILGIAFGANLSFVRSLCGGQRFVSGTGCCWVVTRNSIGTGDTNLNQSHCSNRQAVNFRETWGRFRKPDRVTCQRGKDQKQ